MAPVEGARDCEPAGEPKGGSGGTFMGGFQSTTGAAIMAERTSPVKPTKSRRGGLRATARSLAAGPASRAGISVLEAGQTKCDIPHATGAPRGADEPTGIELSG